MWGGKVNTKEPGVGGSEMGIQGKNSQVRGYSGDKDTQVRNKHLERDYAENNKKGGVE